MCRSCQMYGQQGGGGQQGHGGQQGDGGQQGGGGLLILKGIPAQSVVVAKWRVSSGPSVTCCEPESLPHNR